MRLARRIVLFGLAMVAVALVLGGCGGGSARTTDIAAHRLKELRYYGCALRGVKTQLRGLEAGISATRRQFEGAEPGAARPEILRSMKEDVRLLDEQLPYLGHCVGNSIRAIEGKPARLPPPAPPVVGRRFGPPRIEPGQQALPASPCQAYGKGGTTTIYVYPDSPGCARVAPGERLRVANDTGVGGSTSAVGVRVLVGDYELWLGPGQEGVIPAPVQTYLGRGTHQVRAIGGIGPVVLLLPPVCAIRPPAKPGEELCFH